MSPPSLLRHWYALGPAETPFRPDDPDWAVHRIVEDEPGSPTVQIETPAGQSVPLDRALARSIALPPSDLERMSR
jgi:hypothetical protein